MGTIRSFIAIDVAPTVKSVAQKQIKELQRFVSNFRWVDLENLHITLKFLGNVYEQEIPDLCRAVEAVVKTLPIFNIGIVGVGAFPANDRARVLWLGIEDIEGDFARLQKGLDDALAKMGFQPEKREFQAHLTIGRTKEAPQSSRALADYLDSQANVDFGGMDIDQVIIYSSFSEKSGVTYTPMATIDLH